MINTVLVYLHGTGIYNEAFGTSIYNVEPGTSM